MLFESMYNTGEEERVDEHTWERVQVGGICYEIWIEPGPFSPSPSLFDSAFLVSSVWGQGPEVRWNQGTWQIGDAGDQSQHMLSLLRRGNQDAWL